MKGKEKKYMKKRNKKVVRSSMILSIDSCVQLGLAATGLSMSIADAWSTFEVTVLVTGIEKGYSFVRFILMFDFAITI